MHKQIKRYLIWLKMDEEAYRSELRHHFMGQVKNSKFQNSVQHYKDHAMHSQHKVSDFRDTDFQRQRQRNSGGDADRVLYEAPNFGSQNSGDTYRTTNETSYIRQIQGKRRAHVNAISSVSPQKYHQEDGNAYLYETDSNVGAIGQGSDESVKSIKSSKTVISKKSSQDLRKRVRSQCKLHEVIDETLKQMCNTDNEQILESQMKDIPGNLQQLCKHCSDKMQPGSNQKDVMTEIGKGDFLDVRSGDTLTISVDDVVNSKVINPMIRKLQRMYLNNLKEEMSLMEDLERLPHKVNEVYKATIFKQKE